jgi:hypothetical protein
MQKKYFQLDQVHSITLTYETEHRYKWYDEVPAKPKTFLGIQYGMTNVIPAGWSYSKDGCYPVPTSYFEDYPWYRVDEANNKIYHKAYIDISFGHKEHINHTFNSNEEAQKWVDELIASSDKKFAVIIKK